MAQSILVIDDDASGRRLVEAIFEAEGRAVLSAETGAAGLAAIEGGEPDVVLLDVRLPDLDGLVVLDRIRELDPCLPVVMLTADREVKTAVRAMQRGALHYLTKPIDADELTAVVGRALETRALRREVEHLRQKVAGSSALAAAMGPSAAIARVVQDVRNVAASSFSVLVAGETGTGKELVAQAIHRESERRTRPFIAIDCGAIPEPLLESELFGHERGAFTGAERKRRGHFQLAEGGTIFLDEVGNLPAGLQQKLLRVIEARELTAVGASRATRLDVRFVAATNEDLEARAREGRFRADLYFRLAQYTIALPSLRDRPGDVPHLARRFLAETSVELRRPMMEIAPEALDALAAHPWPGNVRELRNVIRRAVLEAKDVVLVRSNVERFLARADRSPARARAAGGRTLREVAESAARDAERELVRETLRATAGNKAEAARRLKTDYKTLHLKLKILGIRARDFAP